MLSMLDLNGLAALARIAYRDEQWSLLGAIYAELEKRGNL
jgi:hypothetical protein